MADLELSLKSSFSNTSISTGLQLSQISLKCLLGRIISNKYFGQGYVKSMMRKCWDCKFEVSGKGTNLFLFTFESEEDKSRVAAVAPWFISNCHFIIKEWLPNLSWEQVDLGRSGFWIQVYRLALKQMNPENAEMIGKLFAGLLETDISLEYILGPHNFIRLKIALLVDKPLITGFHNVLAESQRAWIRIKLPVYDVPEKGFGPWLRPEEPVKPTEDTKTLEEIQHLPRKPSLVTENKQKGLKNRKKKHIWVPVTKELPLVITQGQHSESGDSVRITNKPTCLVGPSSTPKTDIPSIEMQKAFAVADRSPFTMVEPAEKLESDAEAEYEPPIVYSPLTRISRSEGLSGSEDDDWPHPTRRYHSPLPEVGKEKMQAILLAAGFTEEANLE
ncbi:hypothetical protein Tsubulata_003599 [Turnera subulata]|uniref:DUF4283 domain-containing protein n=1 Tax=Turnera subulata TaxID=218843 RepID=A0A9Q0FQ81_9ROSI|nr:hypothetical protein Tsubulata_003599 [Turnera subulata]